MICCMLNQYFIFQTLLFACYFTTINVLGLKRCGKSCRLRWLNYLRPDIKHGGFTEEEDTIICNLYCTMGSRQVFIKSFHIMNLIFIMLVCSACVNIVLCPDSVGCEHASTPWLLEFDLID